METFIEVQLRFMRGPNPLTLTLQWLTDSQTDKLYQSENVRNCVAGIRPVTSVCYTAAHRSFSLFAFTNTTHPQQPHATSHRRHRQQRPHRRRRSGGRGGGQPTRLQRFTGRTCAAAHALPPQRALRRRRPCSR